jgi:hypothetical protein
MAWHFAASPSGSRGYWSRSRLSELPWVHEDARHKNITVPPARTKRLVCSMRREPAHGGHQAPRVGSLPPSKTLGLHDGGGKW